jgi:hypothetical protein
VSSIAFLQIDHETTTAAALIPYQLLLLFLPFLYPPWIFIEN